MKKSLLASSLVTAAAGLSLGAGLASAAPDLGPLVNTTCSYEQVNAALLVESPDLANELAKYSIAQNRLKQFLAAPVDQRQQIIQQAMSSYPQWQSKVGTPEGQQYAGAVAQVAATCNNY